MFNMLNPSVKLSHYLESQTVAPGDHVRGFLKVEVAKEVEITNISVHVVGQEHTTIRHDKSTDTANFTHYSQWITLFGHSRSSGQSGKAFLSPGSYTYDFDVTLPVNIPPSAKTESSTRGEARVKYTVEGRVVIPWWFDTTTTADICVLSAVPAPQFSQVLSEALPLGRTERGEYQCGCNGSVTSGDNHCFCCIRQHSQVTVSVDVYPYIVLVHPTLCGGYPIPLPGTRDPVIPLAADANILTVRLSIDNGLSKTIHKVSLQLVQKITWTAGGMLDARVETIQLGETEYNAVTNRSLSPIAAHESLTFDATIPLRTNPVPSMKTKYIDSVTLLVVHFPEYKIPDVRFDNNVIVAGCVNGTGASPWVPATFAVKHEPAEVVM